MSILLKKIKEGITVHQIQTNKFKTNIIAIYMTKKLEKEDVTKVALLPLVLKRGTENISTQEDINKKLENLYGANFNCGVEKRGDNQVLKFYIESLNDEYKYDKNDNNQIIDASINLLFDIVFNPKIENNAFSSEYVESEKQHLRKIIESKIDNKMAYAYYRCIEEMFKNKPYGLYEYGYTEDLNSINKENLYVFYKEFINNCKIDIFISGEIKDSEENNLIEKNIELINLKARTPKYEAKETKEKFEENTIIEKMNITQGNLMLGINVNSNSENSKIVADVLNAILGVGANSKLFQNVREKASLAYSSSSRYIKPKDVIIIRSGIEIQNYSKALEIIKQQIEQLKQGEFEEEEINAAKEILIASLENVTDDQGTEITYEMSQELAENKKTIEEKIQKIQSVTKDEIIKVADNLKIETIYFLKDEK